MRRIVLTLFLVAVVGCATNSGVVPMGNDTFMVTRQAATGFTGSGNLKAEALREAADYCAAHGKEMKIVAVTESKPPYIAANFPKAEVVFKALARGDPQLNEPTVADPSGPQMKVVTPHSSLRGGITTSDLADELTKLDDLRKRGLLTDAEFDSQKARILNRAK